MKKLNQKKSVNVNRTKRSTHESTGMNIVANIGHVEMLRHPEFWR